VGLFLLYRMRRVECRNCGVVVEEVPWSDGKHQTDQSLYAVSGPLGAEADAARERAEESNRMLTNLVAGKIRAAGAIPRTTDMWICPQC